MHDGIEAHFVLQNSVAGNCNSKHVSRWALESVWLYMLSEFLYVAVRFSFTPTTVGGMKWKAVTTLTPWSPVLIYEVHITVSLHFNFFSIRTIFLFFKSSRDQCVCHVRIPQLILNVLYYFGVKYCQVWDYDLRRCNVMYSEANCTTLQLASVVWTELYRV
jgi:hypothetical protein